jgi:hypothetical protein
MAKLRRWVHIYDSERPQSQRKCEADEKDMTTLEVGHQLRFQDRPRWAHRKAKGRVLRALGN